MGARRQNTARPGEIFMTTAHHDYRGETTARTPANAEFLRLKEHLDREIIGQQHLTERLLIALLADGHLLTEGAPGLAKTRAIRTLANAIHGDNHRIQFTPDLLPSDITGTDIYRPEDGSFRFEPGPIFHNCVLADEINRAPAKVQSALLEAMEERQVTAGNSTHALPELFLVMATQNPIEQEGTYPLPEAQLDRFLMHVEVDYPSLESERRILRLVREDANPQPGESFATVSQDTIFQARREVRDVHMAPALEEYLVQIILATRNPTPYGEDLARWIEWGASPRATVALDRCSRSRAWLRGREFATPEDVQSTVSDVLRHRVIPSFDAESEGVDAGKIIDTMVSLVPLP
jgi:MoxR-like ATPase